MVDARITPFAALRACHTRAYCPLLFRSPPETPRVYSRNCSAQSGGGAKRPASRRFCGCSGVTLPGRNSLPWGRSPRLRSASSSCCRAGLTRLALLGRGPLHLLPSVEESPGVVLRPAEPFEQGRFLLGQLVVANAPRPRHFAAGHIPDWPDRPHFGSARAAWQRQSSRPPEPGLRRIARSAGSRCPRGTLARRTTLGRLAFGSGLLAASLLATGFFARRLLTATGAFLRLLLGGTAGGLFRRRLVAGSMAGLALARLRRFRAAFLGRGVRTGTAHAGLLAR